MLQRLIGVVFLAAVGCTVSPPPLVAEGDGFDQELTRLDEQIAALALRVEASPTSWALRGQVAGLYRHRARLSGDWTDYQRAEDELARAFADAPDGAGPHLEQAGLDLTLHRLSRVEGSLARAEQRLLHGSDRQAAVATLRGEVAMLRDGYDAAGQLFDAALVADSNAGVAADQARLAWITGDFDTAHALYDQAEAAYHGVSAEPRAWFHLQRGLMDLDRGRYADALAHYRDADAILPGYWLVHEHIAEALMELGREDEAARIYELVARDGFPDLQDTYAELLREQGDEERAAELLSAAGATWEQRLADFPDAAYGHAIGHYLITDPSRAVELATLQLDEQPSAAARTALAEALLAAGRVDEARAPIEAALATRWQHLDTYLTAAEVYEALGEEARHDAVCAQAQQLDSSACR